MRDVVTADNGKVYSPGPHASDFIYRDFPYKPTREEVLRFAAMPDEQRFFLMEEHCNFVLMAHQDKVDAAREKLKAAQVR